MFNDFESHAGGSIATGRVQPMPDGSRRRTRLSDARTPKLSCQATRGDGYPREGWYQGLLIPRTEPSEYQATFWSNQPYCGMRLYRS